MAAGIACWLLIAVTMWKPVAAASGHFGFVAGRGQIAAVHGTCDLAVEWPADLEWPSWQLLGVGGRMQVWTPAPWRPARSDVNFAVGTASATVHAYWLPLWWPGILLPAAGAALWWRGRRGGCPGACAACGYDRRGLAGPCPECGRGAAST